ncbi:DedA family protein [Brevibacillus laterosporus]|uniref:DedA family protein n=1 Tax=Brevibacillus laterosporus TaxID=1465 RepID=UPI000CE44E78|nr:DedA family protein [Brevibacillus laterosporus]MED1662830.1 DedA family protein [Brevibacillus laterosporus]MED1669044.1 DedA family protein [Brevibacillus laterosporus]MED1720519.1 DedA family protein [Brevibacillus laterosporus]PPA88410.1 alkaline phosphatase [Brevibacillus laterosporus]
MHLDTILELINQYGYFALFFALWLGIVGMPIPDEVIVMTGGMVGSFGILQSVPAFFVTYLGVISGLSLGYILGYKIGVPVLDRIRRKRHMDSYIVRAEYLLKKYGSQALVISYFLPIVRHVVPYLVGISKMSFRRYALFSFTTGFVWTLLFFILGHLLGSNAASVGYLIADYSKYLLIILPVIAVVVFFMVTKMKRKKINAMKG